MNAQERAHTFAEVVRMIRRIAPLTDDELELLMAAGAAPGSAQLAAAGVARRPVKSAADDEDLPSCQPAGAERGAIDPDGDGD
jgi:hypothetical protein